MLQSTPKPTGKKEESVKDREEQDVMDMNIKEFKKTTRMTKNNILAREEKDRRPQFMGWKNICQNYVI
jgi:hypothetical protein